MYLIRANKTTKLKLIADATNAILAREGSKKRFMTRGSDARGKLMSPLPSIEA